MVQGRDQFAAAAVVTEVGGGRYSAVDVRGPGRPR
jgi:hypothetical protein